MCTKPDTLRAFARVCACTLKRMSCTKNVAGPNQQWMTPTWHGRKNSAMGGPLYKTVIVDDTWMMALDTVIRGRE